jgi:hypothetical protein
MTAACWRCQSELEQVECETCYGEGVDGHDCGEDSCICLNPEPNVTCSTCGGFGGWSWCPTCGEARS